MISMWDLWDRRAEEPEGEREAWILEFRGQRGGSEEFGFLRRGEGRPEMEVPQELPKGVKKILNASIASSQHEFILCLF